MPNRGRIVVAALVGFSVVATVVAGEITQTPYEPFRSTLNYGSATIDDVLVFSDGSMLKTARVGPYGLEILASWPWRGGIRHIVAAGTVLAVGVENGYDLVHMATPYSVERIVPGSGYLQSIVQVGEFVVVRTDETVEIRRLEDFGLVGALDGEPYSIRGVASDGTYLYVSTSDLIEVGILGEQGNFVTVTEVESPSGGQLALARTASGVPVLVQYQWYGDIAVFSVANPEQPVLLGETNQRLSPFPVFDGDRIVVSENGFSLFEIQDTGDLERVFQSKPIYGPRFPLVSTPEGYIGFHDWIGLSGVEIREEVAGGLDFESIEGTEGTTWIRNSGARIVIGLPNGFGLMSAQGDLEVYSINPQVGVSDAWEIAGGFLVLDSAGDITAYEGSGQLVPAKKVIEDSSCSRLLGVADWVVAACGSGLFVIGGTTPEDAVVVDSLTPFDSNGSAPTPVGDSLVYLAQTGDIMSVTVSQGGTLGDPSTLRPATSGIWIRGIEGSENYLFALVSDGSLVNSTNSVWAFELLGRQLGDQYIMNLDHQYAPNGTMLRGSGDRVCLQFYDRGIGCYTVEEQRLREDGELYDYSLGRARTVLQGETLYAVLDEELVRVPVSALDRARPWPVYQAAGQPRDVLLLESGRLAVSTSRRQILVLSNPDSPTVPPEVLGSLTPVSPREHYLTPQPLPGDRFVYSPDQWEYRVIDASDPARMDQVADIDTGVIGPPFCVVGDQVWSVWDSTVHVSAPNQHGLYDEIDTRAVEVVEGDPLESIVCGPGWIASSWYDRPTDKPWTATVQTYGFASGTSATPVAGWTFEWDRVEPPMVANGNLLAFIDGGLPGVRVVAVPEDQTIRTVHHDSPDGPLVLTDDFVGFSTWGGFEIAALGVSGGPTTRIQFDDSVRSAATDGRFLYLGGHRSGVWKYPLSGVEGLPLNAGFTVNPTPTIAGDQVFFDLQLPCQQCEATWHFGDGESAAGPSVVNRFSEPGSFRVEVQVARGQQEASSARFVDVYPAPATLGPGSPLVSVLGVAHATGFNNSLWRSDLVVTNLSASVAVVSLSLRNSAAISTVEIPGGATVVLEDVVSSELGQGSFSGVCDVHVLSDHDRDDLLFDAVTYAVDGDLRFGLKNPVIGASDLAFGGRIAVLPAGPGVRWNLFAVAEPGETANVALVDRMGGQLGERSYRFDEGGYLQVNDLAGKILDGVPPAEVGPVILKLTSNQPMFAFVSTVDGQTNDSHRLRTAETVDGVRVESGCGRIDGWHRSQLEDIIVDRRWRRMR
jgi:hypothetical protein